MVNGELVNGELIMEKKLTGGLLVEQMNAQELEIARRVESVLPVLRANAAESDRIGRFPEENIAALRDAGLLGLVVPTAYGGLGGGLRDLAAAAFALGTACPSTALCFCFHCSSASRGLLALEALEAGLFPDQGEADEVRRFAERLLHTMGSGVAPQRGRFLANFASETAKSAESAIFIGTEATPVADGWLLNGVKSFGCSTGIADHYLVQAKVSQSADLNGMALFLVSPSAPGISERTAWDAVGMRATATHGIILENVFVPAADALAVPGAFLKMMQMSRGSYVGNQVAVVALYLGIAQAVYQFALGFLSRLRFRDTGQLIAAQSAFHQELIGQMAVDLETGFLWTRRQIELESAETPLLPKPEVVKQWRLCKGTVCESAHRVAVNALKACGTSNTGNQDPIARGLRDLTMGLVQAFPAERGRIEAAKAIIADSAQAQFGVAGE
jgi:alkylation response protein AidB-like acyl-CoA dehydrogenase